MDTESPLDPQKRRSEQIVASTASCQVGHFRAPPRSRLFHLDSPPGHTAVVFPRTAVAIHRSRGSRIVTDSTVVTFYNRRDRYRREVVDPAGDDCVWFWAEDEILEEIVVDRAGTRTSRDRIFEFGAGPCPRGLFGLQRRLWRSLEASRREARPAVDGLLLEETVLTILDEAVRAAADGHRGSRRRRSRGSTSRFLAQRAREYLAVRYAEAPSLDDVARHVGCSKYHLSRVFREHVGVGLHALRTELQLRAAHDRICAGDERLVDVALDLGFSSHSQLTEKFRSRFGWTPSALRETDAIRYLTS